MAIVNEPFETTTTTTPDMQTLRDSFVLAAIGASGGDRPEQADLYRALAALCHQDVEGEVPYTAVLGGVMPDLDVDDLVDVFAFATTLTTEPQPRPRWLAGIIESVGEWAEVVQGIETLREHYATLPPDLATPEHVEALERLEAYAWQTYWPLAEFVATRNT